MSLASTVARQLVDLALGGADLRPRLAAVLVVQAAWILSAVCLQRLALLWGIRSGFDCPQPASDSDDQDDESGRRLIKRARLLSVLQALGERVRQAGRADRRLRARDVVLRALVGARSGARCPAAARRRAGRRRAAGRPSRG